MGTLSLCPTIHLGCGPQHLHHIGDELEGAYLSAPIDGLGSGSHPTSIIHQQAHYQVPALGSMGPFPQADLWDEAR